MHWSKLIRRFAARWHCYNVLLYFVQQLFSTLLFIYALFFVFLLNLGWKYVCILICDSQICFFIIIHFILMVTVKGLQLSVRTKRKINDKKIKQKKTLQDTWLDNFQGRNMRIIRPLFPVGLQFIRNLSGTYYSVVSRLRKFVQFCMYCLFGLISVYKQSNTVKRKILFCIHFFIRILHLNMCHKYR